MGNYLLKEQSGQDGKLAKWAWMESWSREKSMSIPQPASEWQLVVSTDEGRVFHRRGAPLARVRSMASIDSGKANNSLS
jgi:hypothetical protein